MPEHVRTLFDRFHLFDLAIKAVGVGSVGTFCALGLFMAADDDPIFLQVKEARKSVLEPYAGKSMHKNQGERVVAGQRLMQSASDIFLGWTRGLNGRDYYFRQLRDAKISAVLDDWDVAMLREYGKLCAWALARAHARSGDRREDCGLHGLQHDVRRAPCVSSPSNTPTRTFATTVPSSRRFARVVSRLYPTSEAQRRFRIWATSPHAPVSVGLDQISQPAPAAVEARLALRDV